MAQDFSFDIFCGFDKQEFTNAIDQARREIATRYDFKGVIVEIETGEKELILRAESDYKLKSLIDLIESKLVKRNLPLTILDKSKPYEPAAGGTIRQKIGLIESLSTEDAKEISKALRAENPKIKTTIQGDSIRVISRSKDDLQKSISFIKEKFTKLPISFTNFR